MHANRIRHVHERRPSVSGPKLDPPTIPPGFAVCPPELMAAQAWQQEIYRLAYEQAKSAVQVPRHHRMLFSVWN